MMIYIIRQIQRAGSWSNDGVKRAGSWSSGLTIAINGSIGDIIKIWSSGLTIAINGSIGDIINS